MKKRKKEKIPYKKTAAPNKERKRLPYKYKYKANFTARKI
jgi:hypothetical protein